MDVRFTCAHCGQPLEAGEELAGEKTACPSCGRVVEVPAPRPPVPPPVPARVEPAPVGAAPAAPAVVFAVAPTPPATSGLAIASMVLGILGLVLGWLCGGGLLSLLAVIFGHIAYSRIARQPAALSGKGLAIAGFTTGYVGLVIAVMVGLALGTFFAATNELMKQLEQTMPRPPR